MAEQIRYGISALDLSNVSTSVNDELMVRGKDGKMFYKRRTDGVVVSYDNYIFTNDEVVSMVTRLGLDKDTIFKNSTDIAIYQRFNLVNSIGLNLGVDSTGVKPTPTEKAIGVNYRICGYLDTMCISTRGSEHLNLVKHILDMSSWDIRFTGTLTTIDGATTYDIDITPSTLKSFYVYEHIDITNVPEESKANVLSSIKEDRMYLQINTIFIDSKTDTIPEWVVNNNKDIYIEMLDFVFSNSEKISEPFNEAEKGNELLSYLNKDLFIVSETSSANMIFTNFNDIAVEDRIVGYYLALDGVYYVASDKSVTVLVDNTKNISAFMMEPYVKDYITTMAYISEPEKLDSLCAFLQGQQEFRDIQFDASAMIGLPGSSMSPSGIIDLYYVADSEIVDNPVGYNIPLRVWYGNEPNVSGAKSVKYTYSPELYVTRSEYSDYVSIYLSIEPGVAAKTYFIEFTYHDGFVDFKSRLNFIPYNPYA